MCRRVPSARSSVRLIGCAGTLPSPMTRNRPSRGTIGGSPGSVIFTICGCATPHVIDWSGCGEPPGGVVTVAKRWMLASIASWTPGDGQTMGFRPRPGWVRANAPPVPIHPNVPSCRRPSSWHVAGVFLPLREVNVVWNRRTTHGAAPFGSGTSSTTRGSRASSGSGVGSGEEATARTAGTAAGGGAVSSASTTAAPAAEPASAAARARRAIIAPSWT
jgi:hypothetical protein